MDCKLLLSMVYGRFSRVVGGIDKASAHDILEPMQQPVSPTD
jgi:hypothetical protein